MFVFKDYLVAKIQIIFIIALKLVQFLNKIALDLVQFYI